MERDHNYMDSADLGNAGRFRIVRIPVVDNVRPEIADCAAFARMKIIPWPKESK